MKIQTLSIVVGSGSCDAHCPFCVSRMTGRKPGKAPDINWKRFGLACKLAERAGCTTAMVTGKGEPTLFPEQVLQVVENVKHYFPLVELQTNGIGIANDTIKDSRRDDITDWLFAWRDAGLTTVAVSVVHYDMDYNIPIYTPKTRKHFNLGELIKQVHGYGLSMRICCVMLRGIVDSWAGVRGFAQFAKLHGVEQLTFTPVSMPAEGCLDKVAEDYTRKAVLSLSERKAIEYALHDNGTHIMTLPHGAKVFDVNGQNVCLNNCLSPEPADMESLRNLIYMPDGHLYYRWDCEGAIII